MLDKDSWDGLYFGEVSVAEVEHIMLIKFPPRSSVSKNLYFDAYGGSSSPGGVLRRDSLARCIDFAFTWASSSEGSYYWQAQFDRALGINAIEEVGRLREAIALFENSA